MGAGISSGDELAGMFQAAALEPHRWAEALGALAAATGSAHAQLIGIGGPSELPFNWISDIDPRVVSQFADMEGGSPTINFRIAADLLPDMPTIVHEAHYDMARPLLQSEDYLDLCKDFDIPYGCQTRLVADPSRHALIGFALLRARADGATSAEERRIFAETAVHARNAVLMQRAIEHQGFALLSGSMEAMGRACFLLDGSGAVRASTPAAERILSGDRLRVTEGRLTSARAGEARRIDQALRTLYARKGGRTPPPVLLQDEAGPQLMLQFFSLPNREWTMSFAPRAIVVVRERGAVMPKQAKTLIDAFGLTPSEADIALRLASGASREAIATARGVSAETLKAQVRTIYAKTGCSREGQLVHLILTMTG